MYFLLSLKQILDNNSQLTIFAKDKILSETGFLNLFLHLRENYLMSMILK